MKSTMSQTSRLRSSALNIRRSSGLDTTPGDIARNAAGGVGCGIGIIAMSLASVLLYLLLPDIPLISLGALCGGILWGLVGIGMIIGHSVRLVTTPIRSVNAAKCPFCQKENRVLRKVWRFACGQCGTLLVLSKEGKQFLQATECPHCHRPMGVAGGARSECFDCGVTLRADADGNFNVVTESYETCAGCGQPSPSQARFCGHCGHILSRGVIPIQADPPISSKVLLRSEIGSLRYGEGALQMLWQRAIDGQYGGGASPELDLTGISQLFQRLTLVIDCFEDALHDPSLKDEVVKQLPLLNQTYGALLVKLHAELLALKDKWIAAGRISTVKTCEWVTAQHALVARVESEQNEIARRWTKGLIKWPSPTENNTLLLNWTLDNVNKRG